MLVRCFVPAAVLTRFALISMVLAGCCGDNTVFPPMSNS